MDAGIPIAKFRGADPPFQQQHTDIFIELINKNKIKVVVVQAAIDEVSKKYGYLMPSVNKFFDCLKADQRLEIVPNEVFKDAVAKIVELRKDAKSNECDLSFTDSLQIFHAKNTNCLLISWDGGVIDYCELRGINARRPNEFCEEFNKEEQ